MNMHFFRLDIRYPITVKCTILYFSHCCRNIYLYKINCILKRTSPYRFKITITFEINTLE